MHDMTRVTGIGANGVHNLVGVEHDFEPRLPGTVGEAIAAADAARHDAFVATHPVCLSGHRSFAVYTGREVVARDLGSQLELLCCQYASGIAVDFAMFLKKAGERLGDLGHSSIEMQDLAAKIAAVTCQS